MDQYKREHLYLKSDPEYKWALAFLEVRLNYGSGLSPADRNYQHFNKLRDLRGFCLLLILPRDKQGYSHEKRRDIKYSILRPNGIDIYFGRENELEYDGILFPKVKFVYNSQGDVQVFLCSSTHQIEISASTIQLV